MRRLQLQNGDATLHFRWIYNCYSVFGENQAPERHDFVQRCRPQPDRSVTLAFQLSLMDPRESPHITADFGAATALLLFPDWCTQCVHMGPDLVGAAVRQQERQVRVYGLLAGAAPDPALLTPQNRTGIAKAPAQSAPKDKPATQIPPATLLLHSPTQMVPSSVLDTFGATDFPFLIVTDHAHIIRFLGSVSDSVLQPGDALDRVVEHVAAQWPPLASAD